MTTQQSTIGATSSAEAPAQHDPRLSSGEIAQLWATYMQYSLLTCVMKYYHEKARDTAVKELMFEVLSRSEKRVAFVSETFLKENIPVPMGFSDRDVNLAAAPLFSEVFLLHYVRNMVRLGLTINSLHLSMASRIDIRDFYTNVLESIIRLNTKVTDLLLSKGILPRSPYTTISQSVEHVHKTDFLTGFFGEKRPLLTIEIAHMHHNALVNEVGRALMLGFRQVSPNKEVRDYFTRGIKLTDDIVVSLSKLARNEHVVFSLIRDMDVTDSTEAPFSDKLMMFHIFLLNTIGAGMYGVSGAVSARHDIMKVYGQFMIEVGAYAEAGAKLMMANDWLEEPPQILNREELAELKH